MTKQKMPKRGGKADRLIISGATTEEIMCDYALAPLDRVAIHMEETWGIDRLIELVSVETAAKFGSAMAKLNNSFFANDVEEVKKRAEVVIRGYVAMDREARAAGHEPAPPDIWQFEMNGKPCGIIRDVKDWKTAEAAALGVRIYTMREVMLALEHYGNIVASVKDSFPGAEVTAVSSFGRGGDIDDPIPF